MTYHSAISAQPRVPDIRTYPPARKLRPLVSAYYFLETDSPLADFTYPESASIRFAIEGEWAFEDVMTKQKIEPSRASLFGPTDRGRRFRTAGGLVMGIGLTPIGWLTLIGAHASNFANLIVPLGTQLGAAGLEIHRRLVAASGDVARVALIDAIIGNRPAASSPYCEIAAQVEDAILSGEIEDVGELASHVGIEPRRLLRVCTSAFGFPPVRLLRRQRFLRTLDGMRDCGDQPLGQLIDSGYYDQAHFNRDFKGYMGMAPLAYFRLPHEVANRAVDERRRLLRSRTQQTLMAGEIAAH